MPRGDRILLFVLGGALLAWGFTRRGGDEAATEVQAAPAGGAESPDEASSYDEDYRAFAAALAAFRSTEVEESTELRAAAARLSLVHGRHDAPRVTEYYVGLSASERRRGLDDYEEFLGLWSRVAEHDLEGWSEALPALREELRAFAARSLPHADFVPAGRALSLLAEVEVQWLEFLDQDDARRPELLAAAEGHAREALAVFERAGMWTPCLEPLLNLARLEVLQGLEQRGLGRLERCLELAETTHRDDFRELALLQLIRLARASADRHAERRRLSELAAFRDPQDCWPLARHHALLLIEEDETRNATEFLIAHRPRAEDERDAWRIVLAMARLRNGEWDEARRLIDALGVAEGDEDELLLRATLDLRQGDSAAVLFALGPPAARADLSVRGRQEAAVLVGEAHLVEGRPLDALDSLGEARELAESWEARLEAELELSATSASVLGERLGLHAIVLEARALIDLGRPLEAALLIERAQSWRWRGDDDPSGARATELSLPDLRAWAARYEHGLVTWVSGADSLVAVHVDPSGRASGLVSDVRRKALEGGARRLRRALIAGDAARASALSPELIEGLLPETLRESLLSGSSADERLLCLVHGPLESLAFEALELEGSALDERATLLALPELPSRRPGAAPESGLGWTLVGDPVAADGELRLPAARDELKQVEALGHATHKATGPDFEREALLAAIESGQPLHVATHLIEGAGCSSTRFADVGLELSRGDQLCAAEIAGLETDAPLVVLAACETAGGRKIDGQGQQGVARAFLDAGARNLLVTLWPIRDDVARRFTPQFHAALRGGASPSRAAHRARRFLAASGVSAADWAAFRVLGRD